MLASPLLSRSSSHTSGGAVDPKSDRSGASRQIPSLRGPRNELQSSVMAPSARGRGAAWKVNPGVAAGSAGASVMASNGLPIELLADVGFGDLVSRIGGFAAAEIAVHKSGKVVTTSRGFPFGVTQATVRVFAPVAGTGEDEQGFVAGLAPVQGLPCKIGSFAPATFVSSTRILCATRMAAGNANANCAKGLLP